MLMKFIDLFRGHGAELRRLRITVETLTQEIRKMANELQTGIDKLTADVAALTTADAAAVALLNGLSQQLKDALAAATAAGATTDQLAAITALSAGIESNTANLATAVAANTPAA